MSLFLKNLIFTVLVPGTVAVYAPLYVIPHPPATHSPVALAGALVLLAGSLVYLWCLWDFAAAGRGTPAPLDPPKTLVVRGLYRYTRNPMYLGVVGVLAGWALVFRSPSLAVYAAIVWGCFHLMVLLYEEPHLRRVFGPSYRRYRSRVRRWLPIPKKVR